MACEDFSNIIGSSSDSMIYKGTMKGGSEIAVISFCIKEEQWTGYHELYFQREVLLQCSVWLWLIESFEILVLTFKSHP